MSQPMEGQCIIKVMLDQDNRPICLTRCVDDVPLAIPTRWIITEYRERSIFQWHTLPQFQLFPEPQDFHHTREWGAFLSHLHQYSMVAVARTKHCNFYILAPDGGQDHTRCLVHYWIKHPVLPSEYQEIEGLFTGDGHSRHSMDSQIFDQKSNKIFQTGRARSDQAFLQKNLMKTDPSYLRTLGQTHSGWTFGGIAELVDNSRDAHATRLDISIELLYSKKDEKKIPVLSFVDDGDGMIHDDIMRMLSFGHKQTNGEDKDHIGRFGIGFKTGAMKLGRDALVLTQSSTSRSVALLSQSFNETKDNIEIPIVSYSKNGRFMEIDLSIQSEELANFNLHAIKEFSPFNEYLLGEQLGFFGENGTGTQIFIWNLDEWGSNYTLEWVCGKSHDKGDILIRSRRIRSRFGQISREVPLDYSLQAYLEVIFLDPCMKIYIQGSLVKSHPLAKSMCRSVALKGSIMARPIELILGRSQVEWKRMNCGVFLYWHGRLIEAYKRVGGMKHNADVGRGIIGVADVTNIIDDGKGQVWVLNNKQGFQDCEAYAKLEEWLGNKVDKYWDEHFDKLYLERNGEVYEPDQWVQCDKCRKWRMLISDFNVQSLPLEWCCYCGCSEM